MGGEAMSDDRPGSFNEPFGPTQEYLQTDHRPGWHDEPEDVAEGPARLQIRRPVTKESIADRVRRMREAEPDNRDGEA
jgi:hypothetical protein